MYSSLSRAAYKSNRICFWTKMSKFCFLQNILDIARMNKQFTKELFL
jgi:hypothetical protein